MTDIRQVTPEFAVAPQLAPQDMAAVAALGFRRVINNRPDHEAPGQPTGDRMQAAAIAAGMDYVAIPVVGGPSPAQVIENHAAITSAPGPVQRKMPSGPSSGAWNCPAMGRSLAASKTKRSGNAISKVWLMKSF